MSTNNESIWPDFLEEGKCPECEGTGQRSFAVNCGEFTPCPDCNGTGKVASHWPDSPGFYWWRGAPSFRWEMMHVIAYGADGDQSRYMVQKVEARQVTCSLQVWKDRGPECGEWIKVNAPEDNSSENACEHTTPRTEA